MMHREIDSSSLSTYAPHGRARQTCVQRPGPRANTATTAVGLWALVPALLLGCSTTRTYAPPRPPVAVAATTLEPDDEFEAAVLSKLESIPGQGRIAGVASEALVSPAYFAANGRRCRRVVFAGGQHTEGELRLACSGGGPWFYVPLLMIAPSTDPLAQSSAAASPSEPNP